MDHVAIMNKSWKLIPKILSGEKQIESRWYQTRRVPWNKIRAGDIVYFKNSGEPITAQAGVFKVLQFEIKNPADIKNIVDQYGHKIALINQTPQTWGKLPKYCILVFLKKPQVVWQSFDIDKTGFGSATAWLTVADIRTIKI